MQVILLYIYPYGPFVCGDKQNVFIGIQNEREWERFCQSVLKQPELTKDMKSLNNYSRSKNREELKEIIERSFESQTSFGVLEKVESAKIANAKLNTISDFIKHPQLKSRNRWKKVQTSEGEILALKPPVTMKGIDPVMNPVPSLGEHTDSILKEIRI